MLSQKLKRLRAAKSISQSALAGVLGVTQQAVAKWETEKAEPDSRTLKKIANYFGVSTDYLLDNETDNAPKSLALDEKQSRLVKEYDNLNDEGRNVILTILASLQFSHARPVGRA